MINETETERPSDGALEEGEQTSLSDVLANVKTGDAFYVRANDDSMEPRIECGDVLFVNRQTSVDHGDVAVILIDEKEPLVRKIFFGDETVILQPLNVRWDPLTFTGTERQRVTVLGRVTKLARAIDREHFARTWAHVGICVPKTQPLDGDPLPGAVPTGEDVHHE